MQSVQELLNRLVHKPDSTIIINGKQKQIIGMARFTSINAPESEYYKLTLADHSGLIILPNEQEIYISEGIMDAAEGISDTMIGRPKISYKGKLYSLVNQNDYQYTKQLYLGTINDIEGECRFSDYVPKDGTKKMLSLGWLSYTGKRADVHATHIDIKHIEVV